MKTSTDIEKAMADVLNFASLEQKERLHGALDAMLKYSPGQARDDHGRFATGGGGGVGGSAPDTGGGGGISGGSSPGSGGKGKEFLPERGFTLSPSQMKDVLKTAKVGMGVTFERYARDVTPGQVAETKMITGVVQSVRKVRTVDGMKPESMAIKHEEGQTHINFGDRDIAQLRFH